MKLLKSLKQKKRYIVFEVSKELNVQKAVDETLLLFLGKLGLAKASPFFVKHKGKRFIIKVNHTFVDECVSAIILIKKVNDTPVSVKSVITSGTLKKASEKL